MRLENSKSEVSVLVSSIAGGAAGATTRVIAQPLDVLKIRFQLQLEPIRNGSKYSSTLQAISAIVKEEGLLALWSGHVPAQFLSISYGLVQFSTFEKLSQLCQTADPQFYVTHRHGLNFANGAIAATFATVASFPFDIVRTRLIAEQKTNKAYKGFINAFSSMIRVEGASSLFKGLTPTIAQIAPHAGVQFAVYKLFTDNILSRIEFFQRRTSVSSTIEATLLGNLLAGGLAGFIAKTAIYPFDLVKKRMQIQGFQQYRTSFGKQMYCNGSLHCVKLTITEEGLMALYKGFGASMLKAVLTSALHFAVYDEIKYFLMRLGQ